jgi:hypothetical protein
MTPLKDHFGIALSIWLAVCSQAVAAESWNAPFVHNMEMTVIDPEAICPELNNLESFSNVAQSADGKVYATFTADADRHGILVINADTFDLATITWRSNPLGAERGAWCGLINLGDDRPVALFSCQEPDEKTGSFAVYLIRHLPNQSPPWSEQKIDLPEKPAAIAYLPNSDALACLTEPSNWFIRCELKTKTIHIEKAVFDFIPYTYPNGRCLYLGAENQLYGSYRGRLFCYDPSSSFFAYLGMLPCEYGHLSQVALSAMAGDGKILLAAGTTSDGYLFTVDTETFELRSWGRPTDGTEIRKLVHAGPSGFWGLSATPGQSCRLFHFDPDNHLLEDLGIPAGILRRDGRTWNWFGFQISDMLVLKDGRILLAEGAKQAKLLVFDPDRRNK